MTTVWYKGEDDKDWKKIHMWNNIPEHRAHEIADHYNTKYDHGQWWVSETKPGKDKNVYEVN